MDLDLDLSKRSQSRTKPERRNKRKCADVEEANKTEEEQLSHPQNEEKELDQKQSGLSIYEEEEVLRFMEEQEIPQGSGKVYHFIPAERNDTVRNTGNINISLSTSVEMREKTVNVSQKLPW